MLQQIFLYVLGMSMTASCVILLVLVLRLFLKKSPKIFSYALWSVVLIRLLCPFSFKSAAGLIPDFKQYHSENALTTGFVFTVPEIPHTGTTVPPPSPTIQEISSVPALMQNLLLMVSVIWVAGALFMILKNLWGLVQLKKRLAGAEQTGHHIYCSASIETAFVLGLMNPKIYLPDGLTEKEQEYILLHEQTHIRRGDPIIKMISFLALSIHWFNPLVWAAFFASSRDMEMSCDEKVISQMGNSIKKEYTRSLLSLASGRNSVRGVPLAFSEGDTKARIKNALNYKKPSFWLLVLLVIAAVVSGIFLMTDRKEEEKPADMMYAGVDSVILSIDRENQLIHARCLHEDLPLYPEFTASYDERTAFLAGITEEPEDISPEAIREGDTAVFVLSHVQTGETATAYAETVQIASPEKLTSEDAELILREHFGSRQIIAEHNGDVSIFPDFIGASFIVSEEKGNTADPLGTIAVSKRNGSMWQYNEASSQWQELSE